jgi:subtilisin family serine protease/flagellar hook assembly protein FlgD
VKGYGWRCWVLLVVWVLVFPLLGEVVVVEAEGQRYAAKGSTVKKATSPRKSVAQLFKQANDFQAQEVVVKFREGVSSSEKQTLFQSEHLIEQSSIEETNMSLIKISNMKDLITVATKLSKNPLVEYVEPNYRMQPKYVPSDPYFYKQWYLNKVEVPKAWDMTKGSAEVTVAVLDGGIQGDHPDLRGKIVKPYNMISKNQLLKADDHGTHVAGIIAANMNNQGITGIAPNVKIMPVNVFKHGGASSFDVASAVYYAVANKANVINLSLGGFDPSTTVEKALKHAHYSGVVVVAAAGNSANDSATYPAAYETVISVSASDQYDKIASFSNFGETVDFAAPGVSILSAVSGSSYERFEGTSMAAPVVSGTIALMLSRNPLLTPDDVRRILTQSAVDIGEKGKDLFFGNGRINVYLSLKNTPLPALELKASASTFTMSGQNSHTFSFKAPSGTKVSIVVQNQQGAIVKRLMNNQLVGGGEVRALWDGKTDRGTYASNGTYKVVTTATNGVEVMSRSVAVKVVDRVVPYAKFANVNPYFSPVLKPSVSVPYEINLQARAWAALYDSSGKKVKMFYANQSLRAGTYSLTWNGKDQYGRRVKDGNYQVVITATGSKGTTRKTAKLVVDSVKPTSTISVATPIFQNDGKKMLSGKIVPKEKTKVTAYIVNQSGSKVKKVANAVFEPRTANLNWDGLDEAGGISAEGRYYFLLELTDMAGNQSTVKSSSFLLENWLAPVISSSEYEGVYKPGGMTIPYSLNKAGVVSIDVYQGDIRIQSILVGKVVEKGQHTFYWNGLDAEGQPAPDGSYSYTIQFKDKYEQQTSFVGEIVVKLTEVEIGAPEIIE